MQNILKEKPSDKLCGRLQSLSNFIDKNHIKNKIVLDLGCGFGWFEYNFRHIAKKIVGLETNKKNLEAAKKYIKSKNVEFIIGSGLKIPTKNDLFDTVLTSEVIEHIPEKTEDEFFREISRILKKDGILYLTTPFKSFLSIFFDPAWWLIKHRHYSVKQLTIFGERNGFKLKKYLICGKWWGLIGLLDMYISKWVFRRKKFFSDFIDKKENKDFLKPNGFVNIFVVFQKL